MSEVVYFRARPELDEGTNLRRFVDWCRDKLTLYQDQGGFASNTWVFDQRGRKVTMRFGQYSEGSNSYKFEPMEEPFLSFAKAYVRYCQTQKQVSSVTDKIIALRAVHEALCQLHKKADPLLIDGLVQEKVAEVLGTWYPKSAKLYHYGGQLEGLYEFLRSKGIAPELPLWKRPWRKTRERAIRTDAESRKWQENRCPSMHQMLAIADCFARAEAKRDRYWTSLLALLMFAPSRGGELAGLTIDSLHEEKGRLAVRWYGEKGFGYDIKWVPSGMEPVVREAFERLFEIGKHARDAARFAFDHPGVFPVHEGCITPAGFSQTERLDALQFGAAMAFGSARMQAVRKSFRDHHSKSAWQVVSGSAKWVQELMRNGAPSYEDLALYMFEKYRNGSWPYLPQVQRNVWDSLVLVRENELHDKFAARPFSWCLPTVNQLNDQLSQRPLKNPIPTVFQRFGIKDEDGSEIRLTSHQLRVWLSTNAERGGMDSWRLAQWAGRARIQDNRAYDLRTQGERHEQMRQLMLLSGQPSALEAIKVNQPVAYAALGVNRVGVADATLYGFCVHDYSMSPCTKGGECMTCKEHVCVKGMPNTLERIQRLEKQVESEHEKARRAADDGAFGADRWVTHLGWKLAHIRTQRMRLESDETPHGAVLWIPAEHDPSPVKRSLEQKGYDSEPNHEDMVLESQVAGLLRGE